MKRFWLIVLLLVAAAQVGLMAQEGTPVPLDGDCPQLVEQALAVTEQRCEGIERNQVCYGHLTLDAQPYDAQRQIELDEPGDREAVTLLRSLRLSTMDIATGIWGVALMNVEATVEEGAAEGVKLVMFGDVEIANPVEVFTVTAIRDANVRRYPSLTSAVVETLISGQSLTAMGRTSDEQWIQVRLSADENTPGWIYYDLIEVDEDITSLPEIAVGADNVPREPTYGAMQVFTLETGEHDAPCAEAPNSGLIIQTPEGAAEVNLLMNEINISMRATVFFQAQAGGMMDVYVLDGDATVEAGGVSHTLIPGTGLHVPLDESGAASGPPTPPEAYETSQLQSLPVDLLDRPVTVPPPRQLNHNVPIAGTWSFSWQVAQLECPNGEVVDFATDAPTTSITVAEDGSSIGLLLTRYNRVEPGVYSAVFADVTGNLHRHNLTVQSADRIAGTATIEYPAMGCILDAPFTLRLVSSS